MHTLQQNELGGVHYVQDNLMKHYVPTNIRFCILLLVSLSAISCHHSTDPNDPPSTPSGYTACAGHYESYCVPMYDSQKNVWYAFWKEAPDSSSASLIVGLDVNNRDTCFLQRDSTGWSFAPNDPGHNGFLSYATITHDSVMMIWHGVDCGAGYFVKKLK